MPFVRAAVRRLIRPTHQEDLTVRTGTWNARIVSSLVVGLLVLASLFSSGRPAWAQLDCPPPRPEPSVTAQQVDGRQRQPDGLCAGRDSAVQERGFHHRDAGRTRPRGLLASTRRRPMAFRFHVPRDADARRAGVFACKGHVPFGRQAAIPDLRTDSSGTRHPLGGFAGPEFQ